MGRSQDPFILALAGGRSLTDAATEAGIGYTTAKRWRDTSGVQTQISQYRDRMITEAVGKLAVLAGEATETLKAALSAESDGVRVRAALGILDRLLALRSASELEERIAALEARAADGPLRRVG
jgi:hypothetical protein